MTKSKTARGGSSAEESKDERIRAILKDLRVVFRVTQAHSRWVEKQCGVSAVQLWALSELDARPGLSVSELSKALSIHQSTASNMLDKMEAKGLIQRNRTGADQRVVQLFATDAGKAFLANAPGPAQGAISHALAQLPEEVLNQLEFGLDSLIDTMTDVDMDAAMRPLSEK